MKTLFYDDDFPFSFSYFFLMWGESSCTIYIFLC